MRSRRNVQAGSCCMCLSVCVVCTRALVLYLFCIFLVFWGHLRPSPRHDVQDEQHVLFKCTHPHVCSLWLIYASLFSGPLLSLSHSSNRVAPYVPGIHHVQSYHISSFFNQNNNKLFPFLHELLLFNEQASSQPF